MGILNLTQHTATAEQRAAGVMEPCENDKAEIQDLLSFDRLPTRAEIEDRAKALARIAVLATVEGVSDEDANAGAEPTISHAMIGGAPYLMSRLESELLDLGIYPLYAFTERVSVEETLDDGSVIKRSIFRHSGFVEA